MASMLEHFFRGSRRACDALALITIGVSPFPSFDPYRHPRTGFIHPVGSGVREDQDNSFAYVRVHAYDFDAAVLLDHEASLIVERLLITFGLTRRVRASEGSLLSPENDDHLYRSITRSKIDHFSAHERLEIIGAVGPLVPVAASGFDGLPERCPDLFRGRSAGIAQGAPEGVGASL